MLLPRISRNPLAYPAEARPGFDPTHPAAQNIRFSGVANSGFINLLSGAAGTKNSTPTATIDGNLGLTQSITGNTQSFTFASQPTTNDLSFTFAGLLRYTTTPAGNFFLFGTSSAASGVEFGLTTPTSIGLSFPGGGSGPGVTVGTLAINVPYFLAVSGSIVGANCIANGVLTNMATGQLVAATGTISSTGPIAPNGTYVVGNGEGNFKQAHGNLAAIMFGAELLSLKQLAQWAARPWDFWYPPK